MKTFDEEMAASVDRSPFSNGTEWEAWSAAWCETFQHEPDCELLAVALMNRTPADWTEVNPFGLANRYVCHSYEEHTP